MKTMKITATRILSLLLALLMLTGALSVAAPEASAASVVPTKLVLQNLTKWKSYTYGSGTLYDTGCGMFAIVNAVGYLTGNTMSVTEVASWGHAIGGYNPGSSHDGTYRMTIYPRLQAKYGATYGFTVNCGSTNEGYWQGASSTTLKNHLANGGVAIGHVPGHFIAIVGYDSSTNYFHVYDSYPTTARGTGNGDAWVTQSRLSTGKLKLDWFCLLSRTGTVINNQTQTTKYSVTFDSRGGSAVAKQTVEEGAYAKNPGAPVRDGFEFLGWYDENGWLFAFDTTGIWANRQLHAEWKAVQWPQSTDYMPTTTNTTRDSITDGNGVAHWVYPYFNGVSGGVDMYKGGDGYYWPNMLCTYQTSVDMSKTPYLNISHTSTAYLGVDLIFRDANNVTHEVRVSQIANGTDEDFAPGNYTIVANVGNYLYANYSMPSNSIVNIEALRFFVVGGTDSLVTLNAVCFTGAQSHTNLMNPDTIVQAPTAGAAGSYTYDSGVLTMEGTGGYAVGFEPQATYAPETYPYWIVSASADTYFDVYAIVSTSEGDRRVSLRDDYYPQFGFDTYPDNGLPSCQFTKSFNILGMYTWNNILPADGKSVVKSVMVELRGNGKAKLSMCQLSDAPVAHAFTDSIVKSGSWTGSVDITNDNYTLDPETEVLLGKQADITVADAKNGMNHSQYIKLYDGDTEVTSGAAKTGLTVKVVNGGTLLCEYTLAIFGDVNGNGGVSTADVREILLHIVNGGTSLDTAQVTAADFDANGDISTEDARDLLLDILVK